mgnify:CR=1 FL=1
MIFSIFFYCQRPDTLYFMTMKTDCSTGLYGYLCCACLPARCNEGRSSENGALRDTQDTGDFRLSEWKAYNVLNIHSENDRDAVRFEKAHSEHRISRLKLLAAIERDRMDRLRKKIRKDNFGGSVSKPILNHKMIQYWYYVKLYKKFLASANMSAFTPMII